MYIEKGMKSSSTFLNHDVISLNYSNNYNGHFNMICFTTISVNNYSSSHMQFSTAYFLYSGIYPMMHATLHVFNKRTSFCPSASVRLPLRITL